MAKKQSLGMGLDLLLTAADAGIKQNRIDKEFELAKALFDRALAEDEKGLVFEAYHLYRQVIDGLQSYLINDNARLKNLVSQSYNNAAIILYENGYINAAADYLAKAISTDPDNPIARENYASITSNSS